MKKDDKTKEQLLKELDSAKNRIADLEKGANKSRGAVIDLERLFQLPSYMVCLADFDGYFTKISPAFTKTLGHSEKELLEKSFIYFIHPKDKDKTLSVIKDKLEKGEDVINFENRYLCKNGSYKWLSWTSFPVVEERTMFAVAFDSTELKKSEEELRKSDIILSNMAEGVNVVNEQGVITFVNPVFEKMFGYDKGELVGKSVDVLNASDEEENKRLVKGIMESLKQKGFWQGELINRKKDASVFYTYASVSELKIGEERHWVSVQEDITRRKMAEETAGKSQSRFKRLYESNMIGIAYWDSSGAISHANDAFLEIIGYTREELETGIVDWLKMTPQEYDHLDRAALEEIKKYGVCRSFEKEYIRKDGSRIWTLLGAASLEDIKEGGVAYIVDISDRKKAEAELQRLNDELEARVVERTRDLASANESLSTEVRESERITKELQEKNVAFRVLLKQREDDRSDMEQNILSNIKSLIHPFLNKLQKIKQDPDERVYLNLIESNLNDIVAPFASKLSSSELRFSPREIEIASMIKAGQQDKEIMDTLNISFETVKTHRQNIRKKLGIYGKKTNLRNTLQSLIN